MTEESSHIGLSSRERCFERLRSVRFNKSVACVHCESNEVVKRGTTRKDAQQYWCKECETYFNDLTGTIFSHHRFKLEEMFYMIMETRPRQARIPKCVAQIARDLDRDYESVLAFVHDVEDVSGETDEFCLYDIYEPDEI